MSTDNGLPRANGMEMSWVDGGGIESWFGDWFSFGSQLFSKNSLFPRSAIGLAIVIHLAGPFDPLKVSLRLGPNQDVHFFYTLSHLSALQRCALILSANFHFIFKFK